MATQIDVDEDGNEHELSMSSGGAADDIIELLDGVSMTRFYIVEVNFMKGGNGNTAGNVAFHETPEN
jgi:hypothetical protein